MNNFRRLNHEHRINRARSAAAAAHRRAHDADSEDGNWLITTYINKYITNFDGLLSENVKVTTRYKTLTIF